MMKKFQIKWQGTPVQQLFLGRTPKTLDALLYYKLTLIPEFPCRNTSCESFRDNCNIEEQKTDRARLMALNLMLTPSAVKDRAIRTTAGSPFHGIKSKFQRNPWIF
jgi:hypothetical protein